MVELVGSSNLGGYLIHVVNESLQGDVDVIEHPAEEGLPITDHVQKQPFILSISGTIVRPTNERVERVISVLEKFRDTGKLLTYEGRRIYHNVVIQNFTFEADKTIANGYRFTASLKQIRIAKTAYVNLPPKSKTQVKPVSNVGRKQTENKKSSPIYHVVKKGDTYSGLGQKYGVSWQQIEKWNTYSAKAIPIGAKVRVG